MKRALKPEEKEQIKFVAWLRANNIFHFSVVNENNMSGKNRLMASLIGEHNKKMGKVAGVSDLVIFLPAHIIFLEMKKPQETLKNGQKSKREMRSKAQIEFCENVDRFDYSFGAVCYGAEEAIDLIQDHL